MRTLNNKFTGEPITIEQDKEYGEQANHVRNHLNTSLFYWSGKDRGYDDLSRELTPQIGQRIVSEECGLYSWSVLILMICSVIKLIKQGYNIDWLIIAIGAPITLFVLFRVGLMLLSNLTNVERPGFTYMFISKIPYLFAMFTIFVLSVEPLIGHIGIMQLLQSTFFCWVGLAMMKRVRVIEELFHIADSQAYLRQENGTFENEVP